MNCKETIINYAFEELNQLIESWCNLNDKDVAGGEMRECRGTGIEDFVIKIIDNIAHLLQIDLIAKKGKFDKKNLTLPQNNKINKLHQVDIHVYFKNEFIAVIECKSYLDSCYYVRACDDFELFKKFNYNVRSIIFSLENSIDEKTKSFTDFVKNNVCEHVFYMLDGKRSSNKPIYRKEYKKHPNRDKISTFISFIYDLVGHVENNNNDNDIKMI